MNKSSIAIVAALALIGGFLLSWHGYGNRPIELENGLWFGEQARALPEFELIDHGRSAPGFSVRHRMRWRWPAT
ncbi:MAG: hypothetical protein GY815_12020 [Gammaproteobacteria bacterium]|nr:hypothetical protein [Gammaproteobacteria bacterium]